jgi:hypothetical protein
MFAPSFFTGDLVRRYGALNVMLVGAALNLGCLGVALGGVEIANFWWALVLVGVGWNFLYIGGTTLLTESYRPAEQAKAQGANDMLIFLTLATSSFSSGMILERNGWHILNYAAIPLVLASGGAVLWLMLKRRRAAIAA